MPRAVLDEGGHGSDGWQPTSFLSRDLINRVLKTDPIFSRVLLRSAFAAIEGSSRFTAWLKQWIVTYGAVRSFDPNDDLTRQRNPNGGVYLIPMGTGGESELKDENGRPLKGRRAGLREFLLRTAESCPGKLVIKRRPARHSNRIGRGGLAAAGPRIEAVAGEHLYEASPLYNEEKTKGERIEYFALREVILSCGRSTRPSC